MITEAQLIEALTANESIIRARFSRKLALVGSRVSIEDLLQSVALKAFKAMSKCTATTEDELNHWILTIAQNTAESMITHHRSCAKRATKSEQVAIGQGSDEDNSSSRGGFQPADLESDAAVQVEMAEEIQMILSMIDELTPDRARAIRMRYIDQMEPVDIAKVMGISSEAVRCLVNKGLNKIRKALVAC